MDTIDKIFYLIEKSGKNPNTISKELNLKNNVIFTQWKKRQSKPSIENLIKIANYFDVTLDYLTGRNENETQTTENEFAKIRNEAEQKIMDDYRSLDENGKRQLEDFFQYLKSKYADKK